jgi:hypothetical protein
MNVLDRIAEFLLIEFEVFLLSEVTAIKSVSLTFSYLISFDLFGFSGFLFLRNNSSELIPVIKAIKLGILVYTVYTK